MAQRFNAVLWLMGIVATLFVGSSLAWASYVSNEVMSASERLAVIETKIDRILKQLDGRK